MIENVLAKDINGLESRLTRRGYKREGFGRAAQRGVAIAAGQKPTLVCSDMVD